MYKHSQFNTFVNCGDGWILFNAFSGIRNISFVPHEEAYLQKMLTDNFDEQKFTKEQIDTLEQKGFIVDSEVNEIAAIEYMYDEIVSGRVLQLTIIPTRNCNFRCSYCYESFKNEKMDIIVCDALIKFVAQNISEFTGLHVSWFGGEPLVAQDIIEYLSEAFIKICALAKKRYTANITTNGYLLDVNCFRKLYNLRVTKFQITLDGLQKRHDAQRKLCGGGGTFEKIVQNIKEIKEAITTGCFSFVIRTNFAKDTLNEMHEYISFLEHVIGGDKRFSLFARTVSYLGGGEDVFEKNESIIARYDDRQKLFTGLRDNIRSISLDTNFEMLGLGQCVCYAGLKYSYVIDVDGTLRKCTCNLDDNEKNRVGILTRSGKLELNFDLANQWKRDFTSNEKCLSCRFLPICMSSNCPANDIYKREKGCPYEILEFESLVLSYAKTHEIKSIWG